MEYQIWEWLNLFVRWFHVIAAIAWVGASFYFVWLDSSLQHPPSWKSEKGIKGDLWAFHGGGVYEVAKYTGAPEKMPEKLHWFKWEAYTTWLTGSALLILLYYAKASLYLVSPDKWITNPNMAIVASIVFLSAGVAVYEMLVRFLSKEKTKTFAAMICCYIALACYVSVNLFSDRAAFLHVGAMVASIMAANVFIGIIPAQKQFIQDLNENLPINTSRMDQAKLRSLHNNYFTLPVVFCMISNHYAFLYGHPFNWVILAYVMGVTAYARHYFNLKHSGNPKPLILVISTLLIVVLAVLMPHTSVQTSEKSQLSSQYSQPTAEATLSTEEQIITIIATHCMGCHSTQPTLLGLTAPPAGFNFETLEAIRLSKSIIKTSVASSYMPLGNITNMSNEERKNLLNLLEQLD